MSDDRSEADVVAVLDDATIATVKRFGYAIVPREPPPDVLGAGLAAIQNRAAARRKPLTHGEALESAYRAMIEMGALKEGTKR